MVGGDASKECQRCSHGGRRWRGAPSPMVEGLRCYNRRASLLPTVGGRASIGVQRCFEGTMVVLPTVYVAVVLPKKVCRYHRWTPLLPTVGGRATIEGWRCYHRWAPLLSAMGGCATIGVRRSFHMCTVVLPSNHCRATIGGGRPCCEASSPLAASPATGGQRLHLRRRAAMAASPATIAAYAEMWLRVATAASPATTAAYARTGSYGYICGDGPRSTCGALLAGAWGFILRSMLVEA